MKIEFFYYKDGRTNTAKLDLIGADGLVIATLDSWDFKRMEQSKLQQGELKDIVKYCNQYKATDIKEFTPTVF